MSKLKAILGYTIASLMIPVVIITLMAMGPLAEFLVNVTGIEITPWVTGGEVVQTIEQVGYETRIHRPIFDALIGQKQKGFVQIVWGPADSVPKSLTESIDYDHDGQSDFDITLNRIEKTAELKSSNPKILRIEGPYRIGDGVGVRVWMTR